METPGTLGSGGAGAAPSGGSCAAAPRRWRGWKDSLPELPLVLLLAPLRPPTLPSPSCAFTIIHPPLNELRRTEIRRQSAREMPFGHVPLEHSSTGAWEGSTRRVCGGVGHLPPPGYPGTPCQPRVTAWEQKLGGTDTRPVASCPAWPRRQPRPVRAASSLALADHVSLVGFFALGGCVGRLPPPPEEAPSRKQKAAAGINFYSKASLVQALNPEVGRRAGGGSFRPLERAGGDRSGPRGLLASRDPCASPCPRQPPRAPGSSPQCPPS